MTRQPHSTNTTHDISIQKGFTLVELMVTIAIMGIIVAMATPSMSRQLANQRVKDTTSTIENALKVAKTESYLRHQKITVALTGTTIKIGPLKANGDFDDDKKIAEYMISSRSDISPPLPEPPEPPDKITFENGSKAFINGSRVTNNTITYKICDSGSTNESPREVTVDAIANIKTTATGACSNV